jgi:hypothetical protein
MVKTTPFTLLALSSLASWISLQSYGFQPLAFPKSLMCSDYGRHPCDRTRLLLAKKRTLSQVLVLAPALVRLRTTAVFHGLIAVAPLKARPRAGRRAGGRVFHGLIAVAPLKEAGLIAQANPPVSLPRPHRRGPIEVGPELVSIPPGTQSSTASSPWPH